MSGTVVLKLATVDRFRKLPYFDFLEKKIGIGFQYSKPSIYVASINVVSIYVV